MKISYFNSELGHLDIQENILNSIRQNRLPHAYLFYGKEGTGKDAFALEIAKLINCEKGPLYVCQKCPSCIKIGKLEHPDVRFIFPTPSEKQTKLEDMLEALRKKAENPYQRSFFPGKNTFISIDTIRELKYEAKFKLYEGQKKFFIISEADEMHPTAANALLKILEEPPSNLMLILTTSRIHRILPTICSRSQLIHFKPLEGDVVLKIIRRYTSQPPEHLPQIIRLALGNIKLAFDFIEADVIEKREQAIELLRKIVRLEKSNEFFKHLDQIITPRDRRNLILMLFFLLTWFRDALHQKLNPAETSQIINFDLQPKLDGFVSGYPNIDYSGLIGHTEQAIQDLDDSRNLNPTLIFIDLAIKLNRLFKQG